MMKMIKAFPLILVAVAVVYFSIYICIDNGAWAYIAARFFGFEEKYASNVEWIAIAIQSLFFTSDWFYARIRAFLNRRLQKSKGLNHQIYLGYKAGIECLMALPKRTILFGFYLVLIVGESLGLVENAKDYTAVIVFIIAIDRVTKIWPEEKERLKAFSHKVAKRIKSGSAKP
ncbi:hypothetical protein ACVRZS_04230 [Streptococcus ferus]|uniref:Membrane protein n=1 Tax=Streptococcus ferus TaxID=1345 RepID=A0A2X3XZX7_9STRE|nr:hypothetical protein [Streptococcus ferus]SQF40032.1 membrane protein [Streptococcus ferus]